MDEAYLPCCVLWRLDWPYLCSSVYRNPRLVPLRLPSPLAEPDPTFYTVHTGQSQVPLRLSCTQTRAGHTCTTKTQSGPFQFLFPGTDWAWSPTSTWGNLIVLPHHQCRLVSCVPHSPSEVTPSALPHADSHCRPTHPAVSP